MPQSIALVLIDCLYCGSKSKVPNPQKSRIPCPYCGHRQTVVHKANPSQTGPGQGTPKGLPVE